MHKIITIPIALYILSVVLSFLSRLYLAYAPFAVALLLWAILIYRKRKYDHSLPEVKETTKMILFSGIALILGPIVAGSALAVLKPA